MLVYSADQNVEILQAVLIGIRSKQQNSITL